MAVLLTSLLKMWPGRKDSMEQVSSRSDLAKPAVATEHQW